MIIWSKNTEQQYSLLLLYHLYWRERERESKTEREAVKEMEREKEIERSSDRDGERDGGDDEWKSYQLKKNTEQEEGNK